MNKVDDKDKPIVLVVIIQILNYLKEKEAIFRILVALGSIILGTTNESEKKTLMHMAKDSKTLLQGLRFLLKDVENSTNSNKLLSITKQIIDLLKS